MAEDKKKLEQQNAEDESAENGADGAAAPAKKSKKKLIIIIAAIVILVGGGSAGGFFFMKNKKHEEQSTSDPNLIQKTNYFDLDEFLVNLNNPGSQVSFLKTVITLELPNQATLAEVESKMPRIRDAFQVYLRELRNSDLQGSAGLQRLRTELLLRINDILEENKVTDILFKEIIVQ